MDKILIGVIKRYLQISFIESPNEEYTKLRDFISDALVDLEERERVRLGTICLYCGIGMKVSNGCDRQFFEHDGSFMKRIPNDCEDKCHDCGALRGELHHSGCDMEACPICADQLISCGCDGYTAINVAPVEQ